MLKIGLCAIVMIAITLLFPMQQAFSCGEDIPNYYDAVTPVPSVYYIRS